MMKLSEHRIAIITILIALYGAILATYLGYIEFKRDERETRSEVEVKLIKRVNNDKLSFIVVNKGYKPVVIESVSFFMTNTIDDEKNGGKIIENYSSPQVHQPELPITLRRYDQHVFSVDFNEIKEFSKEEFSLNLKAIVSDMDNNFYTSKVIQWKSQNSSLSPYPTILLDR